LENCNPLYRKKLMEWEENIQHESTLSNNDVSVLIHAKHQNITLFALLDGGQHRLRQASFVGRASAIEKALLEALCQLMEGLPIQEIYDHGLLKLEYALRDHDQDLPVSGIINRFNFDPLFQLPQHLIQHLFQQYCEETGYQAQLNYFDSPPNQKWLKWNDAERIQKVQSVLDDFIKQSEQSALAVKVKYIEKTVKVHVEIRGSVSSVEQATLMLKMEKELHKQVEPKLQLYLEPYKDVNKQRESKLNQLN
jgi:NifU-like protein involved in Fe-S cluster formation